MKVLGVKTITLQQQKYIFIYIFTLAKTIIIKSNNVSHNVYGKLLFSDLTLQVFVMPSSNHARNVIFLNLFNSEG